VLTVCYPLWPKFFIRLFWGTKVPHEIANVSKKGSLNVLQGSLRAEKMWPTGCHKKTSLVVEMTGQYIDTRY
jgi:hypothetical protein